MGDENAPSHPEILDELSKAFVANKFDAKFLIRAIVNSKTYQRSSRDANGACGRCASIPPYVALKSLSGEQLFDSLALATGFRENANPNQRAFN